MTSAPSAPGWCAATVIIVVRLSSEVAIRTHPVCISGRAVSGDPDAQAPTTTTTKMTKAPSTTR
jgi:hypothetical protein